MPTPTTTTLWAAYRRLHRLVDAQVAHDLERETGLSLPDYEVLDATVLTAAEQECVRVSWLAKRMAWPHSRLSRQLSRMQRRGLISREPCERDGRGDDVVLTVAGRHAHERATPVLRASVRTHFADRLSSQQLKAVVAIEQTLSRNRPD